MSPRVCNKLTALQRLQRCVVEHRIDQGSQCLEARIIYQQAVRASSPQDGIKEADPEARFAGFALIGGGGVTRPKRNLNRILLDLRLRRPCLACGDVPANTEQLFRCYVKFRNRKVPSAGFDVKPSCPNLVNLDSTR
jgi:hypothetical protein